MKVMQKLFFFTFYNKERSFNDFQNTGWSHIMFDCQSVSVMNRRMETVNIRLWLL